jgi:co-chaperonin GroES (HSP10)
MSEQQAIDVSRIKPIGRHILVRKCVHKDAGLIVLPEQYKETTNFVEILAVGPKCMVFNQEHIGKIIQCPEFSDGLHFLVEGSSEYAMAREEILDPVLFD